MAAQLLIRAQVKGWEEPLFFRATVDGWEEPLFLVDKLGLFERPLETHIEIEGRKGAATVNTQPV